MAGTISAAPAPLEALVGSGPDEARCIARNLETARGEIAAVATPLGLDGALVAAVPA